jgi:hypothetical protein
LARDLANVRKTTEYASLFTYCSVWNTPPLLVPLVFVTISTGDPLS